MKNKPSQQPKMRIACVGEAMIELNIDRSPNQIGFAGDTLNTAIYMRRALEARHEVAFVSVVGTDPLSQCMKEFIENEGVSTRCLKRHPSLLPGIYSINKDDRGERSFHYWRKNSAAQTLFEDGFDDLADFDVIYLSGITLAILSADTRKNLLDWLEQWPGIIAFDSNYRPQLWPNEETARKAIERAWKICDVALPSLDDELALFGDASEQAVLARLRSCGLDRGALKRGARGPVPINDCDTAHLHFPEATNVVDTTAAGDSFNGTFLALDLQDCPLEKSLLLAHQCATKVIAHEGAIIQT